MLRSLGGKHAEGGVEEVVVSWPFVNKPRTLGARAESRRLIC